jgi:tyrosine-protein kinase Etk/Wzc
VLRNTILVYGLMGLLLSLGIVFLRLKLRHGVTNPADIERELGLSVFGTVPQSQTQARFSKELKKGRPASSTLALAAPEDPAIESIRSLRTSLHFLLLEATNSVLLVTGPTPGVGKTFLCANLAIVLAQTGKRVLLIDADLRKGHLHRVLGMSDPGVGLSGYIAGEAGREQAVLDTAMEGLSFIGTGSRPPNPSELLMHQRFADLLTWGARTYDYVIVDAPPILAVTDAAVIARHAAATLLVARAGQHSISELDEAVRRMRQGGARVRGFVVNGIEHGRGYGYGYRYGYRYGYTYRYRYSDAK